MMALELSARGLSTRERLIVQITASRLNGCRYCLDLHSSEAENKRIDITPVNDRERLIVRFTEMGTALINGVDEALIDEAVTVLGEADAGDLVACVATINAWNRIGRLSRK